MSKQVIGKKKHLKCENISGKKYHTCLTTRTHGLFECWYTEGDADHVNLTKGTFGPTVRGGQRVLGTTFELSNLQKS